MSVLLALILPEVLALLQYFVKSPTALAKEKAILTEIQTLISQILAGIPN